MATNEPEPQNVEAVVLAGAIARQAKLWRQAKRGIQWSDCLLMFPAVLFFISGWLSLSGLKGSEHRNFSAAFSFSAGFSFVMLGAVSACARRVNALVELLESLKRE